MAKVSKCQGNNCNVSEIFLIGSGCLENEIYLLLYLKLSII